jgi:hypothetical protein
MARKSIQEINPHTEGPIADKLDEHDAALDALETAGSVTDHGELDGLTDDDHTIYVLLAGRAGGQSVVGGTASGENLDLSSTAHATKGLTRIGGATGLVIDEANLRVGIGATPGAGQHLLISKADAQAVLNAVSGNVILDLQKAGSSVFKLRSGTASMNIEGTSSQFVFNAASYLFAASGDRLFIRSNGDVVIGAGDGSATVLATNATAGFLRVTTSAGTPTGAAVDGAVHIDTTNHKLYFRSGGTWRDAGP